MGDYTSAEEFEYKNGCEGKRFRIPSVYIGIGMFLLVVGSLIVPGMIPEAKHTITFSHEEVKIPELMDGGYNISEAEYEAFGKGEMYDDVSGDFGFQWGLKASNKNTSGFKTTFGDYTVLMKTPPCPLPMSAEAVSAGIKVSFPVSMKKDFGPKQVARCTAMMIQETVLKYRVLAYEKELAKETLAEKRKTEARNLAA